MIINLEMHLSGNVGHMNKDLIVSSSQPPTPALIALNGLNSRQAVRRSPMNQEERQLSQML